MGLTVNGTPPTAIKVNKNGVETNLTVLSTTKNGTTTNVWGKPTTLSITKSSNINVVVERQSSPNQQASTGTLTDGSVIYYGDVLMISVSVPSGYAIETFTVNGDDFDSGSTIVVGEDAIIVTATSKQDQTWHTAWTGNQGWQYYGGGENYFVTSANAKGDVELSTRVTGEVIYDFYGEPEPEQFTKVIPFEQRFVNSYGDIELDLKVSMTSDGHIKVEVPYFSSDYACAFTITKIEQYY